MSSVVLVAAMLVAAMLVPPCLAGEAPKSYPPGIELPEGEGRVLLLAACTRCHDLKGLPAYRGYWDDTRWRSMVETMVKNGAPLDAQQTGVLAAYLARHFGKASAQAD